MTALALLLSSGNGRGGGDLIVHDDDDWTLESRPPRVELVGSWAGDRIVISGDYADDGLFVDKKEFTAEEHRILNNKLDEEYHEVYKPENYNIYRLAQLLFKDISYDILRLMIMDGWIKEKYIKSGSWFKKELPVDIRNSLSGDGENDDDYKDGKVMRPDMVVKFGGNPNDS